MASRSVFVPSQVLGEKGKFWTQTLSDIMWSCWSWYYFSQEKIPHPLIPGVIYLHSAIPEVCRSVLGPPCIVLVWMNFHPSCKKCNILTSEKNLKPPLNQFERHMNVQWYMATRGAMYIHGLFKYVDWNKREISASCYCAQSLFDVSYCMRWITLIPRLF